MSRNTGSSLNGQKPSRMTAPTGSSALQGIKIGLWKSRTGIAEQVDVAADEVALVAPTGIADDARGALVEAAAAAPVEEARRIVRKRHSAGLTLAAHVVSRGDDAEAATAAGPRPFTPQRTGLHQQITHSLQQGLRLQMLHQPPGFCIPACSPRRLVAGSEAIAASKMI